jgi:hypothetical protein
MLLYVMSLKEKTSSIFKALTLAFTVSSKDKTVLFSLNLEPLFSNDCPLSNCLRQHLLHAVMQGKFLL